jgi:hypothetical protein
MNRLHITIIAALTTALAACGDAATDNTPQATTADSASTGLAAKPQSPVAIDYRIIGTPIVGQPLAIDIEVRSLLGPQQIRLQYRINDSTAMELGEAQPAEVSIAPVTDNAPTVQQVSLVPLREGRQFLNVAASIEVEGGRISSAMAIPVQVGAAPRQPETNGTLTTDENDEAIHSLPANEN